MKSGFSSPLLRWFDQYGRKHLPWQNPITPYRVWVSEIMLQQTQVDTVIPYFVRFMEAFPQVQALAQAPLDHVLHLWTGLGYYARARNLHACANRIQQDYKGEFPQDLIVLQQLPGIGKSTAAAIASLAFNQPTAILDGNVKRVLSRYYAVEGWPGAPKVQQQLWQQAQALMPSQRCRDYTQAIMDLGATLCTRSRPKCTLCPLASTCQAHALQTPTAFPWPKPQKEKPVKNTYCLMLQAPNGDFLLQQRPPKGIWGGLWSFPELPLAQSPKRTIAAQYGAVKQLDVWADIRHTFSHYHLDIRPVWAKLMQRPPLPSADTWVWYNPKKPRILGLAAPVKALLDGFIEHRATL